MLVVVPGFGEPNLAHKCEILRRNLVNIAGTGAAGLDAGVRFLVCCYAPEGRAVVPSDLLQDPRITWVFERGIIGQFIVRHAHPSTLAEGEDVLIILDDVELAGPVHWDTLRALKDAAGANIVSPTLTFRKMSHWAFMMHEPEHLGRLQNVCELFCYFMDYDSYKRYFEYVDADNPWMWGTDFLLNHRIGLKALMLNTWHMHHHYWRTTDSNDPAHNPRTDCERYLQKYGTNWDELRSLRIVDRYIDAPTPN